MIPKSRAPGEEVGRYTGQLHADEREEEGEGNGDGGEDRRADLREKEQHDNDNHEALEGVRDTVPRVLETRSRRS